MSLYRVTYQSMTAFYGPDFIEADSEEQAKARFGAGAFSVAERACMTARQVSVDEMRRALRERETR